MLVVSSFLIFSSVETHRNILKDINYIPIIDRMMSEQCLWCTFFRCHNVLKPVGILCGISYPLLFILFVQIDFLLQPNLLKSYQNVFSWYHLLQACMVSYKLTGTEEEASRSWRVIACTVLLRDSKLPVSEHWCS